MYVGKHILNRHVRCLAKMSNTTIFNRLMFALVCACEWATKLHNIFEIFGERMVGYGRGHVKSPPTGGPVPHRLTMYIAWGTDARAGASKFCLQRLINYSSIQECTLQIDLYLQNTVNKYACNAFIIIPFTLVWKFHLHEWIIIT